MQISKQNQKAFMLVTCLTMSRIPLSVLAYREMSVGRISIIPYLLLFFVIAASDFVDGKAARFFRVQSNFGAAADVLCDFFYIMASCYALYRQEIFPLWMMILITVKLAEFITTSRAIQSRDDRRHIFTFDYIGRYTAVGFYALPTAIFILNRMLPADAFSKISDTLYAILLFFSVLSSASRIGAVMIRKAYVL